MWLRIRFVLQRLRKEKTGLVEIVPVSYLPPFVIDVDSTVKTVYGNLEGASVGYNPHKPGAA